MKIVTFTSLYPNAVMPRHGIFVEERLRHLLDTGKVEATVVAPVPWFPSGSSVFGDYGKYARVERTEERIGLTVAYPRYLTVPKIGMSIAPVLLAARMLPVFTGLKRRLGADFVIDAHYLYPDGVAACLLAFWLDLPVIMTARGNDVTVFPRYRVPRRWIGWALKRSNRTITVSEALRTQLIDLGADAGKIVTLRNGVDLKRFVPREEDAAVPSFGSGRPRLLAVGHLIPRKGHDLAIEALALLSDASLVIVGEGPQRADLERLAMNRGVDSRVTFLGNRSQEELVALYNAADILLLPSTHEGMPNVVLESLACGTPVVATDAEGVAELLTNEAAGAIVRDRQPARLADAVRDLWASYPDPAATRAHAESLGWEPTIAGLVEVLEDVCSQHPLR